MPLSAITISLYFNDRREGTAIIPFEAFFTAWDHARFTRFIVKRAYYDFESDWLLGGEEVAGESELAFREQIRGF